VVVSVKNMAHTKVTGTTELMTTVRKMREEMTNRHFHPVSQNLITERPQIRLMASAGHRWQDPTLHIPVTLAYLKQYCTELDTNAELRVTEYPYQLNGVWTFTIWNYGGTIDFSASYDCDDTRFKGDEEGKFIGHIDADGNRVIWEDDPIR